MSYASSGNGLGLFEPKRRKLSANLPTTLAQETVIDPLIAKAILPVLTMFKHRHSDVDEKALECLRQCQERIQGIVNGEQVEDAPASRPGSAG